MKRCTEAHSERREENMQSQVSRNVVGVSIMALSLAVPAFYAGTVWADNAPAPLKTVVVPQPTGGDIIDQAAAVRLGKALFWDMQTGGDGMIACATCHFHAGADNRLTNTVNPGPDNNFQSEGVTGPGQTIQTLTNITTDDRGGSTGIVGSIFNNVDPNPTSPADDCSPDETTPFYHNRRVTGRNAPTVIGAVFNRDNFWDGRANHNFNGLDPFGTTANAGGTMGSLMGNSSLASQADGPPNNGTEMSCAGRTFNGPNSLAAKLLARPALQYQSVDPTDSALGMLSAWPATGLLCGDDHTGTHPCMYTELIEKAFGSGIDADNHFSRIWGQAIQAYESTLIPDQTPMDRYLAGDKTALTSSQQRGLDILSGKGKCTSCHAGARSEEHTSELQ